MVSMVWWKGGGLVGVEGERLVVSGRWWDWLVCVLMVGG